MGRVSVVICTRNRLRHLERCLISILQQTHLPDEIIIVDDGDRHRVDAKELFAGIAQKIARVPPVEITIIMNARPQGIVASRNSGIRAATGSIIAFIDDDGAAHRSWIAKLLRHYRHRSVVGVGGPVVESGRRILPLRMRVKMLCGIRHGVIINRYRVRSYRDTTFLPRRTVAFLQGGNMSFRKSALLKVCGGDMNFSGNGYREETDMSLRIGKLGKLRFEPRAVTYHTTARVGGVRDIVQFKLDRFIYFMHRNTTYLFFKHFPFRRAMQYTVLALRKLWKDFCNGKNGTTRDYFRVENRYRHFAVGVSAALCGFWVWLREKRQLPYWRWSSLKSLACVKLVIVGSSIELIRLESKTQFLRKLFGL